MKKNYDHITEMEAIMARQEDSIKKLDALLQELDFQLQDYKKLVAYYYSDQRMQDLQDDEEHLIPQDLHRGVLSEDEVYNLFLDTHDTALHMAETALGLLKVI